MVARRRRKAIVKLKVIKQSYNLFEFFILNNKAVFCVLEQYDFAV